jgi:hypothetical protein
MFEPLVCRLFGHAELEKVVLGIGRRREFYRCPRCEDTIHKPGDGDE